MASIAGRFALARFGGSLDEKTSDYGFAGIWLMYKG